MPTHVPTLLRTSGPRPVALLYPPAWGIGDLGSQACPHCVLTGAPGSVLEAGQGLFCLPVMRRQRPSGCWPSSPAGGAARPEHLRLPGRQPCSLRRRGAHSPGPRGHGVAKDQVRRQQLEWTAVCELRLSFLITDSGQHHPPLSGLQGVGLAEVENPTTSGAARPRSQDTVVSSGNEVRLASHCWRPGFWSSPGPPGTASAWEGRDGLCGPACCSPAPSGSAGEGLDEAWARPAHPGCPRPSAGPGEPGSAKGGLRGVKGDT